MKHSRHVMLSGSGLYFIGLILVGIGMHLSGYDSVGDVDTSRRYASLSFEHPLGTDGYGRDILMLLMNGVRAFLRTAPLGATFKYLSHASNSAALILSWDILMALSTGFFDAGLAWLSASLMGSAMAAQPRAGPPRVEHATTSR